MDKYNNHGDITLGQPIDKQDFNRPYKKIAIFNGCFYKKIAIFNGCFYKK